MNNEESKATEAESGLNDGLGGAETGMAIATPFPAFEIILAEGRHIKIWASSRTEGIDEDDIVINRMHPMLLQLLNMNRVAIETFCA